MYSKKYNKKVRGRSKKLNVSQNRKYYTKRVNKQKKTKKIQQVELPEMSGGSLEALSYRLTKNPRKNFDKVSTMSHTSSDNRLTIVLDNYRRLNFQVYVFYNGKEVFPDKEIILKMIINERGSYELVYRVRDNKKKTSFGTMCLSSNEGINMFIYNTVEEQKKKIKILHKQVMLKFIQSLLKKFNTTNPGISTVTTDIINLLYSTEKSKFRDKDETVAMTVFLNYLGYSLGRPLSIDQSQSQPQFDLMKFFMQTEEQNRISGIIAENLSSMYIKNEKISADAPKYAILFLRENSEIEPIISYTGIIFNILHSKIEQQNKITNATFDTALKELTVDKDDLIFSIYNITKSQTVSNLGELIQSISNTNNQVEQELHLDLKKDNTVVRFATVDLFNPTPFDAKFELDEKFYNQPELTNTFLEDGLSIDDLNKISMGASLLEKTKTVIIEYMSKDTFRVITQNKNTKLKNYVVLKFKYNYDKFLYLCDNLPLNLNVLDKFFQYYHKCKNIQFKYYKKGNIDTLLKLEAEELKNSSICSLFDAESFPPIAAAPAPDQPLAIYVFDFDNTLTDNKLSIDMYNNIMNQTSSSTSKTVDDLYSENRTGVAKIQILFKHLVENNNKIYIVSRNIKTNLINILKILELTQYITGIFAAVEVNPNYESTKETNVNKLYDVYYTKLASVEPNKLYNSFYMDIRTKKIQQLLESNEERLRIQTEAIKQHTYLSNIDYDTYWANLKVLALETIETIENKTRKDLYFFDDNDKNISVALNNGYQCNKLEFCKIKKPVEYGKGNLFLLNSVFENLNTTDPAKPPTLNKANIANIGTTANNLISKDDLLQKSVQQNVIVDDNTNFNKIKEMTQFMLKQQIKGTVEKLTSIQITDKINGAILQKSQQLMN